MIMRSTSRLRLLSAVQCVLVLHKRHWLAGNMRACVCLVQMGAQLENLVAAGGGLVEGTVQRVTYRSDDTGYSVLQVAIMALCRFSCTVWLLHTSTSTCKQSSTSFDLRV